MNSKLFAISILLLVFSRLHCCADSNPVKYDTAKRDVIFNQLTSSVGIYSKRIKIINRNTELNVHIKKSTVADKQTYGLCDIFQIVLLDTNSNSRTIVWWTNNGTGMKTDKIELMDVSINQDMTTVSAVYHQNGFIRLRKFKKGEDGAWRQFLYNSLPVFQGGIYPRHVILAKYININTLRVQTKEGSIEHWDVSKKPPELLWWNGIESDPIGVKRLLKAKSEKYVDSPVEPEYPEDE